ncbi:hypothetical protein OHA37_28915 [Streptomyces sp. NBC_00335]|uniref:hypothetical protein n=1 Tax=unclassified Streptomyces TaxID=2593676 RepID=UPI00224E682C|nr:MULTISPECIES: hypothetical protein [unclassified Streptomyces]MCX5407878.1 hypothetical protein [Streptomyces sp. NBC_00086]
MTEAVTPYDKPDQPPSEAPSAPPAPASEPAFSPSDIRDGAAIALVIGVAGVLLGLLWVWLAPRVQYVSNGEAVFLRDTESEARIGSDATFLLLSVGFGVLSALAVFLWRRSGGAAQVVGLAVGSVFAALVGWRVGLWLGPSSDLVAAARKAGKGVPFEAPLELLAHGALLGWPMAAVVVHLGLTALWGTRDPAPELAMWPSAYYQAPVDSAVSPASSPSSDPSGTEPPRP